MSQQTSSHLRVGVVIPTYKSSAFVGAAVRSVLHQSFADWAAVVVDDGSPDPDLDVAVEASEGDRRFRFTRQTNGGVAAARNAGAALIADDCQALLFLDADDELEPEALARLLESLQAHPEAVGAYGGVVHTDDEGLVTHGNLGPAQLGHTEADGTLIAHTELLDFGALYRASPIACPSAMAVRAETFRAVGGFSDKFSYSADTELELRLAARGPFVAVPWVVVRYRKHSGGMTATQERRGYDEIRRMRAAVYRDPTLHAHRPVMRQAWRSQRLWLAGQAWEHVIPWGSESPKQAARAAGHLLLCAVGRPVDLSARPWKASRA